MSDPYDRKADPTKLRGLRQAMFVLRSLNDGTMQDQIYKQFRDVDLVSAWLSFLQETQWLVRDSTGKGWRVTEAGLNQIETYYRQKA